jgi:hypothetical protein
MGTLTSRISQGLAGRLTSAQMRSWLADFLRQPHALPAALGVHRLSAACILSLVPSTATFCESRRSTRVPLKVVITIEGGAQSLRCEGETIVVNLHGALISTAIALAVGMRISIRVYLTDKRAAARVVCIDPKNPLQCGIELDEPRNIWGVPLPPDDWEVTAAMETEH